MDEERITTTASTMRSAETFNRQISSANADLPFLVTHWLSTYGNDAMTASTTGEDTANVAMAGDSEERDDAVRRVHRAASELASAFASLGAYGTSFQPNIQSPSLRNATYADLSRRWSNAVPPSHLSDIVQSSASATLAAQQNASSRARPRSVLDASYEGNPAHLPPPLGLVGTLRDSAGGGPVGDGGRRVGYDASSYGIGDSAGPDTPSVLQPPALLTDLHASNSRSNNMITAMTEASSAALAAHNDEDVELSIHGHSALDAPPERRLTLSLGSDHTRMAIIAANASRSYLSLKKQLEEDAHSMNTARRSLMVQLRRMQRLGLTNGESAEDLMKKALEPAPAAASAAAMKDTLEDDDSTMRSVELDAERIIAQLKRRLEELTVTNTKRKSDTENARREALSLHRQASVVNQRYRDPFRHVGGGTSDGSKPTFSAIMSRPFGASMRHSLGVKNGLNSVPTLSTKAILLKRMSHAVTINTHLFYPTYCLRFDRTGQYFVTGADDQLVKLFHLGCGMSGVQQGCRPRHNYGANKRGAVLVCTLRGHAGVITDIDISADNALLATASEDGDCRIWGLRDGCPVAILRGHTGGANMVSWSVLTPFRLVTTGQDGLAKMWDVREAALKRYGGVIGKRSDYTLPKPKVIGRSHLIDESYFDYSDDEDEKSGSAGEGENSGLDTDNTPMLPPLPVREQETQNNGYNQQISASIGVRGESGNNSGNDGEIVVPPLPPGAEGIGQAMAGPLRGASVASGDNRSERNNNIPAPGAFAPGDGIDEGVRLIAKLQHGDILPADQQQGPGTRSSRKAVKVICITRCPVGGHFATGSDDGLGRIWADEDDRRVERLDMMNREKNSTMDGESKTCLFSSCDLTPKKGTRHSGRLRNAHSGDVVPSKSTLVATLAGHLNAITDMQYSNAGDRILTASQKDGVVRIWSWGKENVSKGKGAMSQGGDEKGIKFSNLTQVLIRLTDPTQSNSNRSRSAANARTSTGRRRGTSSGSGAASTSQNRLLSCDVAVWTSDDAKVVTAQSCLVKASGTEIVPGTQIMYVWDSRSGQCLLGLSSAHVSTCPVIIAHPTEPSIMASAGADGCLNVWDLSTGRIFFSHQNTLLHGPAEPPTDRGKNCGYLDGSFSPDGLHLVLTDDSGRITIVDCLSSAERVKSLRGSSFGNSGVAEGSEENPLSLLPRDGPDQQASRDTQPEWVKEQYFANDYYDLFYDANGYCIERGSEQPPHLAPRAVRCSHLGVPCLDIINEAFAEMNGPFPLSERECRIERDAIRSHSVDVRKEGGLLSKNVHGKRSVILAESEGTRRKGCESGRTPIYNGRNFVAQSSFQESAGPSTSSWTSQNRNPNSAGTRRGGINRTNTTGRPLSSNYRWSDWNDVLHDDPVYDEDEEDDEEYEDSPHRARRHSISDDSISDASDMDGDFEVEGEAGGGGDNAQEAAPSLRSGRRRSQGRRLGGGGNRNRSESTSAARSQRRTRRNNVREQSETLEETVRNQPSRVSERQSRRQSSRRTFEDPGSSEDESIVEFMSTNTTPRGEYVEDYHTLGHLFRLPNGFNVQREWLRRLSSRDSSIGKRTYCPQVGDSVVYIPRAHYDTIQKFPTRGNSSPPWKNWPTNSPLPVVRCTVQDIRYRFPYDDYYRRRGDEDRCTSLVAILSLVVTGIPEISANRVFPWPKPEFISRQTRSSCLSFELSIFINGEPDFIIPEHLYVWRLTKLEAAIHRHNDNPVGLDLISFFSEEGNTTEDAPFISYGSKILQINNAEDDSEYHFQHSGYNVILVRWQNLNDEENDVSPLSAWEAIPMGDVGQLPPPPTLDEAEKDALKSILDDLEEDNEIKSWFYHPVNMSQYSDYLNMVELPMCLSFIRSRIDGGYYSNKLSVASDMKLIVENSAKYNDASEITDSAREMYDRFMKSFERIGGVGNLSPRRHHAGQSGTRSNTVTASNPASSGGASPAPRLRSSPTRSSARLSQRNGALSNRANHASSLENLPQPSAALSARRSLFASSSTAGDDSSKDGEENEDSFNDSDDEMEGGVSRENDQTGRKRPRIRITRPTRASSRISSVDNSDEEDEEEEEENEESSEDDESESEVVQNNQNTRSTRSSKMDIGGSSDEESSIREGIFANEPSQRGRSKRPARVSARRNAQNLDDESSVDDDSTESSDEKVPSKTRKRSCTRSKAAVSSTSAQHSGTGRPNTRSMDIRHTRSYHAPSYKEPDDDISSYVDSDQEMSDSSDDSIEEENVRKSKKRQRGDRSGGVKKKPRGEVTDGPKAGYHYFPDIARWPPSSVPMQKISRFAKSIMAKLDDLDPDNLFRIPVTEEFPDMADAYLRRIKDPMDFRTIKESRIPTYENITQLQDDLVLTFRNCCAYNGEGSNFYEYSVEIWEKLNDVFKEVCEENQIRLPRRW